MLPISSSESFFQLSVDLLDGLQVVLKLVQEQLPLILKEYDA